MRAVYAVALLAFWLKGCALTSKSEALSPRYFSPDVGQSTPAVRARALSRLELRLGQIGAASQLEERIAYRLSPTELGYYEDRRWTEPPEEYLRRALGRELFEDRGLRRVVSGAAPTLDVELVEFEELRYGDSRARVALLFSLRDDRTALIERRIVVEQPIAAGDPKEAPVRVAVALSNALSQAVSDVADEAVAVLEAEASKPSHAEPAPPADDAR
jgi:cholesterol transport system auxiliary component